MALFLVARRNTFALLKESKLRMIHREVKWLLRSAKTITHVGGFLERRTRHCHWRQALFWCENYKNSFIGSICQEQSSLSLGYLSWNSAKLRRKQPQSIAIETTRVCCSSLASWNSEMPCCFMTYVYIYIFFLERGRRKQEQKGIKHRTPAAWGHLWRLNVMHMVFFEHFKVFHLPSSSTAAQPVQNSEIASYYRILRARSALNELDVFHQINDVFVLVFCLRSSSNNSKVSGTT